MNGMFGRIWVSGDTPCAWDVTWRGGKPKWRGTCSGLFDGKDERDGRGTMKTTNGRVRTSQV